MKKIYALISLLMAAAFVVSSCASKSGNASDTKAQTTAADTSAVSSQTGDKPNIPDSDYKGKVFNLYYVNWSLYQQYYFAETENGEAINDADYKRTAKVEEQLNIDIKTTTTGTSGGGAEQLSKLKAAVMAGDSVYDLCLIHNSTSLINYVSEGLVLNWNKMPYVDMDKSYWNQSVRENMELDGVLPFASNDFVLPDVNSIFFNSDMLANLRLESPYKAVLDGKWTWDKLTEMSASASADINGDGVFDDKDQYGFVGESGWQFGSIPTSCNIYTVTKDSDGKPHVSLSSEKMVSVVEKIDALVNKNNLAYTWPWSVANDPNAGGTPPVSFDSGRALFYSVPLSLAKNFRQTEVDFGIVPLPKYDEKQENYVTLNWAGFLCVPMTASDPELVGKTVELLAYYNNQIVVPAFYDILLGQKISRDADSVKMLDIIFDGTVYDLGIYLGSEFYGVLRNLTSQKSTDFASYYASKKSVLEDTLSKYYTAHEDYKKLYS